MINENNSSHWTYLKLYFGTQAERADNFIIDLRARMAANANLEKWFYLRYIDESGFHIRLRFLPHAGKQEEADRSVRLDCADMLNRMYEYLPSTYRPMVSLPEFLVESVTPPVVDGRVRIEDGTYAAEYEKYGNATAMPVAESLFHLSSDLAGQILADEAGGLYSRKTIAGWLMYEAHRAFPAHAHRDYWRQYSLYWLGGDTPAAGDWRARFARKSAELRDRNLPALPAEQDLPAEAVDVLRKWRTGLQETARKYAALPEGAGGRADVLSLNFSHLMMNRIGIATLEEAYLAALLESFQESLEAVA